MSDLIVCVIRLWRRRRRAGEETSGRIVGAGVAGSIGLSMVSTSWDGAGGGASGGGCCVASQHSFRSEIIAGFDLDDLNPNFLTSFLQR